MSELNIMDVKLNGVVVLDEDVNGVLSVGDTVEFNAALPGSPNEDFLVTVSDDNYYVIDKLLRSNLEECTDSSIGCGITIAQFGKLAAAAWINAGDNSMSGVKFFGNYQNYILDRNPEQVAQK